MCGRSPPRRRRATRQPGECGEIKGRCAEMCGDVGSVRRCAEMCGDVRRSGEIAHRVDERDDGEAEALGQLEELEGGAVAGGRRHAVVGVGHPLGRVALARAEHDAAPARERGDAAADARVGLGLAVALELDEAFEDLLHHVLRLRPRDRAGLGVVGRGRRGDLRRRRRDGVGRLRSTRLDGGACQGGGAGVSAECGTVTP